MIARGLAAAAILAALFPVAAYADSFALIVTNNRSLELGRPDLRYADDDGAKYYELFTTLAPTENVILLTDPDRDTRRLFPEATAAAAKPTRANVAAAAKRLAAKTRAALAAGRDVQFYFVFAGHGDVDKGRGFLELADGPFDAIAVKKLLEQIPYSRAHVILDSCNSFFVISPRKAGGRRFATPKDAAASAVKNLPNVGVFLSTSAEAEVFEWSALQSGIFSHVVRSGLSGAADANSDGRVTYRELEAFTHIAAQAVRNPLYRPKVYARGPGGAEHSAIVDLSPHRSAALKIDDTRALRITVRDADELAWIDTYKEQGVKLRLVVPKRLAANMTVDDHGGGNARVAARGVDDLFRGLFASPFGPKALARYEASIQHTPPPVYGIDREDAMRMELLLSHTAGVDRQAKLFKNGAVLGGGVVAALVGTYMLTYPDDIRPLTSRTDVRFVGWGLVGFGGVAMLYGGIRMLRRSKGEEIYSEFREGMATNLEPGRIVARTELRLDEILERDRTWRRRLELLGWAGAVMSAVGLVGNELFGPKEHRPMGRFVLGAGLVGGVVGALVIRNNITPVERMVQIWRGDPGIRRLPRITVSPAQGGAVMGLGGSF